jgi:hypothetical protein
MPDEQLPFPSGHLRNSGLLSSHWLENRLPLEPEWKELRGDAQHVLDQLLELWKVQRTRVASYGDEQGLEQGFIQPVLSSLGWKLKYQTYLQGRKPDYALFLTDEALDSAIQTERTSPDFWKYPTVVADSKAWHVSLDRSLIIGNQREYPPQQIEWYLDRSHLDFAILTNGKLWRLIPREYGLQQRRFQTYLVFDLTSLLDDWTNRANVFQLFDDFLCFYLFFSPAAFREIDGRTPLLKRAIEGSSEYRLGVGEGLKERAFEALRLCIEGFLSFPANGLNPETDLLICREQSFVMLYRLLFIMYAEDRRLLPYRVNRLYTNNRSLGRHRDQITVRLDRINEGREREDFSKDETALWSDLIDLFDLVDRGHKTYGVPAYNGGLFDPEARPFLAEKSLSDWYVARIVDQLGRASDLEAPGGLFRVDYHDLAIQHLGGIYEGLLELHPHYATEPLVVATRRVKNRLEEKVLPASMPLPAGYKATKLSYHPGEIYLLTDRGERRATGSYYTPDHIVNYIVERTLGPVCKAVADQLQSEISDSERQLKEASDEERAQLTERFEKLRGDFDDRVLRLRVLDPAMGSGHFLLRACQYLAEEMATHPSTQDASLAESSEVESSLTYWKRLVVEHCLYGVDMNELAVELAKLALWLETVAADRPLTFLDHHLRHGNSLIGATITDLGGLPGEGSLLRNQYAVQIQSQLRTLLDPLTAIGNAASETAEQVKEKDKLLRALGKAREPFRLVADLWTSTVLDEESELGPKQYQSALEVLTRPVQFKKLSAEPWFYGAVNFAHRLDINCFHWELEFPEVFFGETGRRGDAGFDAIIGNPPYDVLSELETGHDLEAFRRFIDAAAVYKPSRRGKNNLYKLFICRALELLADGGHMGFITPMPVLGDDQAADIRRRIVEVGAFTGIEAFPQKDDSKNRVFPEAKLSTAVFTLVRNESADAESRTFISRVHPGRMIESDSPSLTLSTTAIPLYDPSNYTIVSCSQTDWDLATRIMSTERMVRLKDFVEFFQGEVNETNERKNGNLTDGSEQGKLVTRGASICLYVPREASQGSDLFLNVDRFLSGKGLDTKAFHHRYERVGWQESCPQNNFRRVIAAVIQAGEFCNHKVNYLPEHKSRLPLRFVLGLLNSKLVDWYFRLGSTNAAVSHYQMYNLPCPLFAESSGPTDRKIGEEAGSAVSDGDLEQAFDLVQRLTKGAPFSPAPRGVIVEAVNCIVRIETDRGEIARVDRSQLAPTAQPYQDFIDQLFYATAGLTPEEASGLENRLAQML